MSNLVRRMQGTPQRSQGSPAGWPQITLDQALQQYAGGQFGYGGLSYGPGLIQTIQQNKETIHADFLGYVNGVYKSSGPVFACILTRMLLFSEARFQFRQMNNGRPGKLFGTNDLQVLETPWQGGTTGDLLMRMELDASLAGNFFGTVLPDRKLKSGKRIVRLRPDWMTIVMGSMNDMDIQAVDPEAELIGYIYTPGGAGSGAKPRFYLPEQVCHYAPIPDAGAQRRGMSWLEPVVTEIMGDRSMSTHKLMYFENGASPNLVVSMETGKMDRKTFKEWVNTFENEHSGSINAYKTLYLGQGASATVVGANIKDLDYAVTQGHGETRLAAAAGVPAIIVGFSEGLESSTYSNFAQARRAFADKTLRPLWRNCAGSLENIITVPGGAALWYDDRDISFLKADAADSADIQLTQATAIRLLVDAGYDPESIIQAVVANDFSLLKHSGLYSVQLQEPGADQGQGNGNGNSQGNGKPQDNGGGNGNGNGNNQPSQTSKTNKAKSDGQLPSTRPGRRATILPNVDNVVALAQALKDAKVGDPKKK